MDFRYLMLGDDISDFHEGLPVNGDRKTLYTSFDRDSYGLKVCREHHFTVGRTRGVPETALASFSSL
jgi:hypothetical protein